MTRAAGPSRLPLAGLILAALLAAGAQQAAGQDTWTDEELGYQVLTMDGWEAVPVEPTERYVVAKWASPRPIRDYPCRMLVYVFRREPEGDDDQKSSPAGEYARRMPFGVRRSFKSWLKGRRSRKGMKLEDPRGFKVEAPEGVEVQGRYYEGTRPSGYVRGGKALDPFFYVAATFTTKEREFALELFCGEPSKRRLKPYFQRIVKSFRLIPREEARDDEGAGNGEAAKDLSPRERARKRAEDNTKVPGWWYEESEHYIIVTNLERKHRPKILRIRRQLEAMRTIYERDFPPSEPIEAISIVRVCKDRQSYSNYGGPGGTAGYWYAPAEELVLYMKGYFRFVLGVLNHEAFHQYIYYACGKISPHTWFNEGYGEYYYGTEVVGKRGIINPCRPRVDTIKAHIREGTHVPMEKFLRYSKREYYGDASRCYAQGWATVYFLKEGVREGHPWSKILPTYFDTLVETRSRKKALEAALDGVDLEALEKAWAAFIVKGRPVR